MLFIRAVYLYRAILINSFYASPRAQRVCAIYGCDSNFTFTIKALMKESPTKILCASFVLTLVFAIISLRLVERYVNPSYNTTTAMWNMIITLTSVGFGDFYPLSNLGRLVAIMMSFWGVFFLSIFVDALRNFA